jgi:hypothetical protein
MSPCSLGKGSVKQPATYNPNLFVRTKWKKRSHNLQILKQLSSNKKPPGTGGRFVVAIKGKLNSCLLPILCEGTQQSRQ